jgi:hypothetical protein
VLTKTDRETEREYLASATEGVRRALARYTRVRAAVQDAAQNAYDLTMLQVAQEAVEATEKLEQQRSRLHESLAIISTFISDGLVPADSVALLREAIQREDAKQEGGESM